MKKLTRINVDFTNEMKQMERNQTEKKNRIDDSDEVMVRERTPRPDTFEKATNFTLISFPLACIA